MTLRVIDAGPVSAVRSQALWHGIAESMHAGDAPVLSFCAPAEPYVCLGYHRRLSELDLDACARLGLPMLRRQIGGGPVYLDSDQLFFQLSLPVQSAPAQVSRIYSQLLEPAATALRWLGVPAEVASTNDIVAHGRKVSGTGAGQIGGGVVVVGNVMFGFPHERMAQILRVPDESMRAECLTLMRDHLGTLASLRVESVKNALRRAYGTMITDRSLRSTLREDETDAITEWEQRMLDPEWIAGPDLPQSSGRQVKIRAGVWVYDRANSDMHVRVTVEHGRVRRVTLEAPTMNGCATGIAQALVGVTARVQDLAARLEEFGDDGARVLDTLAPGMVVR